MLKKLTPGRKVLVNLPLGRRILVRVGDQISEGIYSLGCHEPRLTSILLPLIKPGMTVFDVGANIGYFTVLMASRVGRTGRVHAFEINDGVLDLLEDNIKESQFDNVTIVRMAVARKSGNVDFFVPKRGDEAEGSIQKSDRYDALGAVKIPAISLDEYIHEKKIAQVHIIKIDIEGGECAAFEGAKHLLSSGERPIIMFEALDTACASHGVTWLDTVERVRSFGYRIHQGDTANFFAVPE